MSATAESRHLRRAGRRRAPARKAAAPAVAIVFPSILFLDGETGGPAPAPETFTDLGLDLILTALTKGKEEYDLLPFLRAPLRSTDAVEFRHQVMKDLERPELRRSAEAFASAMRTMRNNLSLAHKAYYQRQAERWLLDAIVIYADAVKSLLGDLTDSAPLSPGLEAFRRDLQIYVSSPAFLELRLQAHLLTGRLSSIHYVIHLQDLNVQVSELQDDQDYSVEVADAFRRFQQEEADKLEFNIPYPLDLNHVEAHILDCVASLRPETFSELTEFVQDHEGYLDQGVANFDRELQFYLSWLAYISPLREQGLGFCYPMASLDDKTVFAVRAFDLALAAKLSAQDQTPVTNDFQLSGTERIIVITGPNQGGKTTFARMFGQLHYLASLGLTTPGDRSQLMLFDNLFSHFERGENTGDQRGKLQDDLIRIKAFLDHATNRSIIIMNEIFTSTTLRDALVLSKKIMMRMIDLDMLSVWVTFVEELASLGPQTVSMVSTVDPETPTTRTFKIVRRPADGLSHAVAIAERRGLTYDQIKERLGL